MKVHFEVENRKELVKVLEELTLEKAKYLRVPSCDYQIGSLNLSKDNTLSWGEEVNEIAMEKLLAALKEKGFTSKEEKLADKLVKDLPETTEAFESVDLTIVLPKDGFTPETWENLNNLLAAKGELIQKALGLKELPEVIEGEDRITFPWFSLNPTGSHEGEAYSRFVCALVKLAKEQKRVTSKAHPVENEKFAFRCFLLRLGFIGKEYKETRKVLLKNLTGSAAFKTEVSKNEISK